MAIRSFVAFELPVEIRGIITGICEEVRHLPLDVRWVKPSGIHLTVVFMGNVEKRSMGPIQEAVGRVCLEYGPFSLALRGMGVFGSRRSPRVLWIGLDGEIDRMAGFRDRLQDALGPFGIRQEKRPFRPHLTLGRFRKGAVRDKALNDLLDQYRGLGSPRCGVDELTMFRSDLGPGGAVYHALKRWPLGGSR